MSRVQTARNIHADHDDKAGTLNGDHGQELSPLARMDWKNPETLINYFRIKYPIKNKDILITASTRLTRFFEIDEMFPMMITGPLTEIEEALHLQKYKIAAGVCFYGVLRVPGDIKDKFGLQCPEIPPAGIENITLGDIIKRIKILLSLLDSHRSKPKTEMINLPKGKTISGFFASQAP